MNLKIYFFTSLGSKIIKHLKDGKKGKKIKQSDVIRADEAKAVNNQWQEFTSSLSFDLESHMKLEGLDFAKYIGSMLSAYQESLSLSDLCILFHLL